MNMYASFCRAIDDGLFDEVKGAETDGSQRLIIATDPFVAEGTITKKQQQQLAHRLDERRQRMLKGEPSQ